MQAAEYAVDPGKHRRIVLVEDRRTIVGVMPVMEGRGRERPFQLAKAPFNTDVDEKSPDRPKEHHQDRGLAGIGVDGVAEAQRIERHKTAEPRENEVHRMGAGIHQPIDVRRAVMDGVESPQQRHLVTPAVAPVESDLGNHRGREEAKPHRPVCEGSGQAGGNHAVRHPAERHGQHQGWNDGVQEVIADVSQQFGAENLSRTQGKQPFQWHEDQCEQHKPAT
jgi:hypothetical protein